MRVQERTIKGKTYVYLDKTVRIKGKIFKSSIYVGPKKTITKKEIVDAKKKQVLHADNKIVDALTKDVLKIKKVSYPFTPERIKHLEEMNLKYAAIRKAVHKKDWEDIKKRFIANIVFESNALEGNSLTLKEYDEILFENKILRSADLREVYDAKNSYEAFNTLYVARRTLNEEFIISLHKKLMKGIDERTGYKKLPNMLLGRKIQLTAPKDVSKEMKELLEWYGKNRKTMHALELAFRFHHKFTLIHPFADGNGRVGRMLLNYILLREGYYPIIMRNNQRAQYLKALATADNKQYTPLIQYALERTKETYQKFFETYYKHI